MNISDFISNISAHFNAEKTSRPWELTTHVKEIIEGILPNLGPDFKVNNGIALHKTTVIEKGVTIKGPFIALEHCHISANAYFREGVFLDKSVKIGPGSEIKSSIICSGTTIAHLNYIGNSLVGHNVNFEAGSIAANHFNERENKRIWVRYKDELI
ncbi:MAG: LpxA family transferase, partial [Maribacter sp.]|uniref:LpxA family transferase n=1 Tax=Maribacter sp. TaxID=1897614 RepID=UPI003C72CBD4